jgi:ADP-heptose:LPS heptosyltransferase
MLNILVIPPDVAFYAKDILSLIEEIKAVYPESSVSVVVSLSTYDSYYNSQYVDGLIIEPESLLKRLSCILTSHYPLALVARDDFIWKIILFKARIKYRLNLKSYLDNTNKKAVINSITALNLT